MKDEEHSGNQGTHPGRELQLPGFVKEVRLRREKLLQLEDRVLHLFQIVDPSQGVAEEVTPRQ